MIDITKPMIDDNGCWKYDLALSTKGYFRTTIGGKWVYLHIHNYEQKYGKVPEGYELDHTCKHRACANPDHVEAVTHQENVLRGKTTKYGPDVLTKVIELSKQGFGYRRIGAALGIHRNSALYLLKRLGIKEK